MHGGQMGLNVGEQEVSVCVCEEDVAILVPCQSQPGRQTERNSTTGTTYQKCCFTNTLRYATNICNVRKEQKQPARAGAGERNGRKYITLHGQRQRCQRAVYRKLAQTVQTEQGKK